MTACTNSTLPCPKDKAQYIDLDLNQGCIPTIHGCRIVGVDLAARVYQVCYKKDDGTFFNKQLKKDEFETFIESLPDKCIFGFEACSGNQYWAKFMKRFGHEVRILPTSSTDKRRGARSNKDDEIDAMCIWKNMVMGETECHPHTIEELTIKKLYQGMDAINRCVYTLVALTRGMMIELGCGEVRIGGADDALQAIEHYQRKMANEGKQIPMELTAFFNLVQNVILGTMLEKERVERETIYPHAMSDEDIINLMTIPGLGALAAVLLKAHVGEINRFKSRNKFLTYCGAYPKHDGSGGKLKMGEKSRMGDQILSGLLFQSALSIMHHGKGYGSENEPRTAYIAKQAECERPFKKNVLKIDRKILSTCYSVLKNKTPYDPNINSDLGKSKANPFKHPNHTLKKTWHHQARYADFSKLKEDLKAEGLDTPVTLNSLGISDLKIDFAFNAGKLKKAIKRSERIVHNNKQKDNMPEF
jgi:transposase